MICGIPLPQVWQWSGPPIPVIKELLGHADIATTMIYAHLSPHLYQAAIDKLPFEL